ncbi:hypothetical protein DFH27DRAFT_121064 [Peziza echinospora]|nr:hypothetical protein DFH27DRAFT_121064 [Peziza echinospora]
MPPKPSRGTLPPAQNPPPASDGKGGKVTDNTGSAINGKGNGAAGASSSIQDDYKDRKETDIELYGVGQAIKSHLESPRRAGVKKYWYSKLDYTDISEGSVMARAMAVSRYLYMNKNKRFGIEQALGLSVLALYDLIILADNSSSMVMLEEGKRREKLDFILKEIADIYYPASNIDEESPSVDKNGVKRNEGITHVKILNGGKLNGALQKAEGYKHVIPLKIKSLMAKLQYEGLSEIGTELERKVLEPYVYAPVKRPDGTISKEMRKPVLVIIITDGQIEGKEHPKYLEKVILKYTLHLENEMPAGGRHAVSYQFARVGNDPKAAAFLNYLDDHKQIGKSIDCMREQIDEVYESSKKGELGREEKNYMISKLLLGSIDTLLDEKDKKKESNDGKSLPRKTVINDIDDMINVIEKLHLNDADVDPTTELDIEEEEEEEEEEFADDDDDEAAASGEQEGGEKNDAGQNGGGDDGNDLEMESGDESS